MTTIVYATVATRAVDKVLGREHAAIVATAGGRCRRCRAGGAEAHELVGVYCVHG